MSKGLRVSGIGRIGPFVPVAPVQRIDPVTGRARPEDEDDKRPRPLPSNTGLQGRSSELAPPPGRLAEADQVRLQAQAPVPGLGKGSAQIHGKGSARVVAGRGNGFPQGGPDRRKSPASGAGRTEGALRIVHGRVHEDMPVTRAKSSWEHVLRDGMNKLRPMQRALSRAGQGGAQVPSSVGKAQRIRRDAEAAEERYFAAKGALVARLRRAGLSTQEAQQAILEALLKTGLGTLD
jgi:hypothetical protein